METSYAFPCGYSISMWSSHSQIRFFCPCEFFWFFLFAKHCVIRAFQPPTYTLDLAICNFWSYNVKMPWRRLRRMKGRSWWWSRKRILQLILNSEKDAVLNTSGPNISRKDVAINTWGPHKAGGGEEHTWGPHKAGGGHLRFQNWWSLNLISICKHSRMKC